MWRVDIEVPNQWVKWGKHDILFLNHWVFFWGCGGFIGNLWGFIGGSERSLWMGKSKNDDVVLGGYVSLVFIDFHRQDFEAAGRYLDSDWRTSLRWFSFKWFICVWLTYENGYVHRFSIAMSIYICKKPEGIQSLLYIDRFTQKLGWVPSFGPLTIPFLTCVLAT